MSQQFYNTVQIDGEELKEKVGKCVNQDKNIAIFFEKHPSLELTPFQVQEHLQWYGVPITSIRRSMNTLTKKGCLIKTDKKAKGIYGIDNYKWRYNFKSTLF